MPARTRSLMLCVATATLFAAFHPSAHGQIWTGAGDGENWFDGANWDAGIPPTVPGQFADFDGNFAVLSQPIQIDGSPAISGINLRNSPRDLVIADDEPLHPFLSFALDGGGGVVPIKLGPSGGYSLTFAESLSQLQLNDDVEVDHQGTSADVFRIETRVFGGKSLTLLPGSGRAELTGSFFQLHNLITEMETQLGDNGPTGLQDVFSLTGDFQVRPGGTVSTPALVQSGAATVVEGYLNIESGGFLGAAGPLIGSGRTDVQQFGTLQAEGPNGYGGQLQVLGGTVSVSSPFGGPVGSVNLQAFSTIATNLPTYDPTFDPAVVVDPSVTTPGNIGLGIDNVPAWTAPIDLNYNNGVANGYRLGSPSLSVVQFATPITPFDNGVQATYYLGGTGILQIDTELTDSMLSGVSAGVQMPFFPTPEFGVNTGQIVLNSFNTFTGPVLVEQEQLVLTHPLAMQTAASVDVVATSPTYQGGNYQHGTIVLDPGLIGSYAGPAPELAGGALGFTMPHSLAFLPTATGLLAPVSFDASGFDGGSATSNLLALGGGAPIVQDPTFVIDDSLDPNGNPVVLVTTDRAFVQLTQPNFHTGGTAVVGHSILEIDDALQLGPGPLNIADGATLRITNSTFVPNNLDFHSAGAFGHSVIEIPGGVSVRMEGNMSTAAARQATIVKQGQGRLALSPVPPWLPAGGENSWGLEVASGDVVLDQLPEYDPSLGNWQTGPLVLSGGFFPTSLHVTNAAAGNASVPDNSGFRVLKSRQSSKVMVLVEGGTALRVAGVDDHHEVVGSIDKVGRGTLWFGGDSSGGDAVGSTYEGRGELNVLEGTVRFGNLPGTDDQARAFPNDMIVHLQRNTVLVKEQDQLGRVHSLYVNDLGIGVAEISLNRNFSGLGDGSLDVDLDSNGTFNITGGLLKMGDAPLRFRAQPGATIAINPGAGLQIDAGSVEVDGSGIDPFTDTATGVHLSANNNSLSGGLHVTQGNVHMLTLSGVGRTRVEAGAKLEVTNPFGTQEIYEINGELVAPISVVGGLLTGNGQVTGDVVLSSAALAPNDDVIPGTPTPATLTITGNLTMAAGDEVNIDVDGSTGTADLANILGGAQLGGNLTLDVHSPFASLGLTSQVILSAAGGIPVPFATVPSIGDYLGAGVEFAGISYGPTDVTVELMQTVYADFNEDRVVNALDLAVWHLNYGATGVSHAQGDADLDGDVDGRDFLVWQRQTGTTFGTLPSITPTSVPEPATCLLLVIAGLALATRRR